MPASIHVESHQSKALAIQASVKTVRKKLPSWRVRCLKANGIGAFLQQLKPAKCQVLPEGISDELTPAPIKLNCCTAEEESSTTGTSGCTAPAGDGQGGSSSADRHARDRLAPAGRDAGSAAQSKRRRKSDMPAEIRSCPELQKYWYQRYRLFSRFDEGVRLDRDGWFSVTPERIARHLADRCRCDVIVDAFCGVGGNTIQFAATCRLVIAVDICPKRVELARHNAALYGVQDRVQFVVADFFQVAPHLRADVVFLSPPWGGPQYCDQPVYDMYRLDGTMDGREMMRAARRISRNVAILAPRSANSDQVEMTICANDPFWSNHPKAQVTKLAALAGPGGRVEVEQNLLNGRAKTVTAYYGDLVGGGGG